MRRKILDQQGMSFLTLTVVEWVDVFTRKELKKIIIDSLRYCREEKSLGITAYVLMSNHLHIIAYSKDENVNLSDIIRDFKKYTSKKIVEWIQQNATESRKDWLLRRFAYNAKQSGGRRYQVWQHGNHPVNLFSSKVINQKISYIHQNPMMSGIVFSAEQYVCSSASNYFTGKGVLTVDVYNYSFSS